ncbi:MAG: hypothetical protein AAF543_23975 [Pseudomonadota bacterium]
MKGVVVASGSHGGLYPAAVASRAGLRAVIFNDAGIGLDEAGIAGVKALAEVGMAAAAADAMSCHIGSADDMMAAGRISFANGVAARLGVVRGMTVAEAMGCMARADMPSRQLAKQEEARRDYDPPGAKEPVLLVDSASLVQAADRGRVIVTGSHGGLIGGDPSRALKTEARLAVFNDASFGKDNIGSSRLPALDGLGIAAVTVAHNTARIGDAASALETGMISARNSTAEALGCACGMTLKNAIRAIATC